VTIENDGETGERVIDLIKSLDAKSDEDKSSILNFEFNSPLLLGFVTKRKKHKKPFLQNDSAVNLQNIYSVSDMLLDLRILQPDKTLDHASRRLNVVSSSKNFSVMAHSSLTEPLRYPNVSPFPNKKNDRKLKKKDGLVSLKVLSKNNKDKLGNDLNYYVETNEGDISNISYIKPASISNFDSNHFRGLPKVNAVINNKQRPKIRADSNIKIHADNDSSNILKDYNADAMTVEQHIFFSKDKFNLKTPSGFALFIHELTHVRQLKDSNSLYSNGYGMKTNHHAPSSMWEKEALDNEKLYLKYYNYLGKKQRESTTTSNYEPKKGIKSGGLVTQRKLITNKYSNLVGFNSNTPFHQRVTGKDRVFGYRNNASEDLNFDLNNAKAKIDDLINPVSVEQTDNDDFFRITKRTHSPSEGYRNEQTHDNQTLSHLSSPNNAIGTQNYLNTPNISVPLLSFGKVSRSESDIFNHNSEPNLIYSTSPSSPPQSHTSFSAPSTTNSSLSNDGPISHSMALFAETNRSVDFDDNNTTPIMQNSIAQNAGNTPHSGMQLNSFDLESIAEKVYRLIQSNIKIQKSRVGIR
jgi:hypothetical protein